MTDKSTLDGLRSEIDQIDTQLVELLAKRAGITKQVGEYKSQTGLPIYVPSREAELLQKRKQQAAEKGVSPVLVEDLLRRIMRESYQTQNNQYLCTNPELSKIVIVGGAGALGSVFKRMFERSGYDVAVLEKDDWKDSSHILSDAGLVIVSVPIRKTVEVIELLKALPKNCVLADITSTKSAPIQAMLAAHSGPVLGLHPMFGPDVQSMVKQVIVVCHGRSEEQYEWLLQQFRIWGAALYESTPQEHDDAMAFIQVMRHFCSFVYGAHLAEENPELTKLVMFSSPIYRLELAMVGRLFAQDPVLYADIIFGNKDSVKLLRRFQSRFDKALSLLENDDKEGFIGHFREIASWFGDYAKEALQDSKKLLLKADDDRSLNTGI